MKILIVLAAVAFFSPRSVDGQLFESGTRGGTGGVMLTVWDAWALRDALSGNDARIIQVRGRIDLTTLFTGSPGVVLDVGSWKTIIGGDQNAEITGGGLRIKSNQQVIIQNIKFTNAISYAPGEQPNGNGGIDNMANVEFTEVDAILCEEATNVWVDHCEFSGDPRVATNNPKNMSRHGNFIDIKRGSNTITVSNNIFRNNDAAILVDNSDNIGGQDRDTLNTVIVSNWFDGTHHSNPTVRFGKVHVLNNLYTDISHYGIGVGQSSSIYAEKNVFINTNCAWQHPDGTPDPTSGKLRNVDNWCINSSISDDVSSLLDWNPNNYTNNTTNNYYKYQEQPITLVENHVRRTAGTF